MVQAIFTIAVLWAAPIQAQPTPASIVFADGFVSVNATDVPAADLLAIWARMGHTEFEGVERLARRRVTLALQRVNDTTALHQILGSEYGFVASVRVAPDPALSMFTHVVIGPPKPERPVTPAAAGIPELSYEYTVPAHAGPPAPDSDLAAGLAPAHPPQADTPASVPELVYEYIVPPHAADAMSRLPVSVPVAVPASSGPDYLPPELRYQYVVPPHALAPPPAPQKPGSGGPND